MGEGSYKLSPATSSGKPIDLWLGLTGIAASIVYANLPKTPLLVIVSVFAIFICLLHPIWNFWWIEKSNALRAIAVMCWVIVSLLIGYASWPAPATKITTSVEIAERHAAKNPPPRTTDGLPAGSTPIPQDREREPAPKALLAPREQLTITAPTDGATVSQNPPIEFTYVNVPADHHLWLIVVGDEPPPASDPDIYWPLGYMPLKDGLSVIPHKSIFHDDPKLRTWQSKVSTQNAWFNDAGKKYRLELIAVDNRGDRSLGREYEISAVSNFPGVSKRKYDYAPDTKWRAKPIRVTRDTTK